MDELEIIDTLEAHLQQIIEQQGLQRIWGEKPGTYIVHGLDLQKCFEEVIGRVWFQRLNGEKDLYVLEGQLVFQLENAIYILAQAFLYHTHVANMPQGVQVHYRNDPPPRDWSVLGRRYSIYLDSVFEKLYTYWNHQATLLNYFLPLGVSLKPKAVIFLHVIQKIPAKFHHLESYQWLHHFAHTEYEAFNKLRQHVVHHGPFQARHQLDMNYDTNPQQEREHLLEYLNAPLQLRNMVLLARESYYHLLRLLVAMDAHYYPVPPKASRRL